MVIKCTSDGKQNSSLSIMLKCRQSVDHVACQLREKKEQIRVDRLFHALDKMSVSSENGDNQQESNKCTSSNSSIFTSDEYLYTLLAYCTHCYRIFSVEKETGVQYQQGLDYDVCDQCVTVMKTLHPSVHTFSKIPSVEPLAKLVHDYYHLDITCNGCSLKSFNGKRYQCGECSPTYNLCENCFGKKHTHHKFKYIQNPTLCAQNQQTLAIRTLSLVEKNSDCNWRDSITGWTKSDAEKILKQGKKIVQIYEKKIKETENKNKRELKAAQRRLKDSNPRILDAIEDANRRLLLSSIL
ncbi:unnamed protein product [Adineta steineri]|uniref:ZZ-type domain-containing protein n=1 Tax=Adineta steineri TaxID=433720 RepID=A0A814C2P8_9BILA|nr:unnamed protein product [Adineta steineri]CAF4184670.1 unnamed protein product [Adineta steineri]